MRLEAVEGVHQKLNYHSLHDIRTVLVKGLRIALMHETENSKTAHVDPRTGPANVDSFCILFLLVI